MRRWITPILAVLFLVTAPKNHGMDVTVNGRLRALARPADRFGRPLPRWSGCVVVGEDQLFLLNADHPSSLDGRYFGPLPRSTVLGRATPLFVDDGR